MKDNTNVSDMEKQTYTTTYTAPPMEWETRQELTYCEFEKRLVNQDIRMCSKETPNDADIKRCGLTDGIGDAMEEAARRSITEGQVYVLSVRKSGDGSYRTHREGTCDGGHYEDTALGVFLHYAYIAERVGEDGIYKINNTQI